MKDISLEINGVLFDKLTVAENYRDLEEGQEAKTQMDDREGMAYVFGRDLTTPFVNGNCLLDLDLIMVDSEGKITAVHTMKRAAFKAGKNGAGHRKALAEYVSPVPYRYVFELKAGMAARLGAKAGGRLDVDYDRLYPFRNAENVRYAFQLKKVVPKDDWIAPLLGRMEKIVSAHDAVREFNLEFAGGRHELETLAAQGWVRLDGIDTKQSGNLWLQKELRTAGMPCLARLCVSSAGHFRHLYFLALAEDGAYLPGQGNTGFDAAVEALRPDFVKSRVEEQPRTVEEELERIVWHLTNPSVKEEWSEGQKKFYIWGREFSRQGRKSRYYVYRLLDGMLRFGDFCDYDFVLIFPLCAAAELNYRWATARLAVLALTRAGESKNPAFWNDLGFALDHMGEKEAALHCFANAWNQKFDALYANNIWLMGNAILPDLLKNRNWSSLLTTASIMLSAISDKATVKQQVEVLCLVGLYYETRDDFAEAESYYAAAYDVYRNKSGGGKTFSSLRWDFPILYQAGIRSHLTDRSSCRAYVEAQLESFPETPLESGFDGRLPVKYVEGDDHGGHWDCVVPEIRREDPQKFFGVMIREGKVDSPGVDLPEYEQGNRGFMRGVGFRYSAKEDAPAPAESYFLLGITDKGDTRQFASAFPVFRKGCGSSIISMLRRVNVWANGIEATVEFSLLKSGGPTLAFFLPDYCGEAFRLKPDTAYRIELGAFAYSVSRFEERVFKIDRGPLLAEEKLRLRKEGKDDNIDSVSFHLTSDFCNITQSFSGRTDDISVVAPIERIEKFTFLGTECLTLWVKFDERGAGMTLPVFLKEENLADGYRPQVGDVIYANCWLQGWVHESHDPGSNTIAVPEAEEDEEDDGFGHGLLAGVRGTDHDLDQLAVRALELKGAVDELCRCPEALPGDADFSCWAGGSVRFVKVMTGYFENGEMCRAAWNDFCRRVVPRPDGREVCLLAVVGIKLCEEQYKIYYDGFSKLNPAAGKDDELGLEQEPPPDR